jgi:putative flippase GtrA
VIAIIWAENNRFKNFAAEFTRYLIVGGTAFLVDYGVLFVTKTYIFASLGDTGIYIATAFGFIAGLIYNYILSLVFVFKSAREQDKGKTAGAIFMFALIGVIGFLLTEGGMYLGCQLLRINYLIVKIFVAGLVLIWNYAGRKLLIFK